ncbi:MAG: fibronectin type III domain-containing protein [Ottowia sp.]
MNANNMPTPVKNSPRAHDAFITFVKLIVDCVTGNANYPNPTPSAASLADQANDLALANAKAKGGGPGVVADRNFKRKKLEADIDHFVDYLKGLILATATDPAAAIKLILGAGLSVRKNGFSPKAALAAKNRGIAGEVVVTARAVAGAVLYFWEHSLDGVTWISVPETTHAKTTIAGLTAGQMYHFRVRVHTAKGKGEYSDVVKCRVA